MTDTFHYQELPEDADHVEGGEVGDTGYIEDGPHSWKKLDLYFCSYYILVLLDGYTTLSSTFWYDSNSC